MGIDLLLSCLFIAALCVLGFSVGGRISRLSTSTSSRIFVESLFFAIVFACFFVGDLAWAGIVPDSAVLFWMNWVPVFLSLAAGVTKGTVGLRDWQRSAVKWTFLSIAGLHLLAPLAMPIFAPAEIAAESKWRKGVCLQSHEATCAAAAAATLLKQSGVLVSESEMASECLSSRHGTVPLGLYRGLARVAATEDLEAKVAERRPAMWASRGQLPNIAIVHLDPVRYANANARQRLSAMLGPKGDGHAVVVLGKTDGGRWLIGDPAIGLISWSDEELQSRFTGDAIYLD